MDLKEVDWRLLFVSFFAIVLVAGVGSVFTSRGTDSAWFDAIRPSITPPDFVFPIVWNVLFFMIALSLYFSLKGSGEDSGVVWLAFGANFIFNILWSFFYFYLKMPFVSFIDILFVWATILLAIFVSKKFSKVAPWLLVPYLLWVSFAAILNYLSIS